LRSLYVITLTWLLAVSLFAVIAAVRAGVRDESCRRVG